MCRCGKLLRFDDSGTCLWCGHGDIVIRALDLRRPRLRRLPRDLGTIQREGRRPDPHLDNVVRLDRLRDRWKVPRLASLKHIEETLDGDWSELEQAA